LEVKRDVVETNLKKGLMPFAHAYLGTYDNHFSTIGINGMHEALLNLLGKNKGIDSAEGKEFAVEVLKFMREKLSEFQEETGNMYNLEAAPCESASYRFALRDRETFPDVIQSGTKEAPYYTNSTHLPVGMTDDIFEALDHQDELQALYSGGTVLHGFIGEKIEDPETCKRLVKKIAYNYRLPYFTITPSFSICPEHGYISGVHHECNVTVKEKELAAKA
jgi:ribonucleoside-triphosphate reductase